LDLRGLLLGGRREEEGKWKGRGLGGMGGGLKVALQAIHDLTV